VNTVLVVDDDRLLRTMTEDLLARHGFRSVSACTGDEGMAILADREVGTVLLDLILPDSNGLELLPQMHRHRPEVPVIIMTAYASLDSAVEAIKKGAYDYITKPLDPVLLCNTVGKALESYRLIRSNRELVGRLEERVQRLELVNRVGMAVTATLQLNELMGTVRETLSRLFRCEVQLWLKEEEGGRLRSYGPASRELLDLVRKVLAERLPLCHGEGVPAMAAPLVARNRTIGVMGVFRPVGEKSFDPEDFEIYKALVSFLAIAMDNARLTEALKESKETVEEYSHTLEARVRQRTAELEQRHDELQRANARLIKTTAHLEQSNRQLRDTRDRLLSQEKMASLGVVAAGVAHEINNPIGFINSNLETLEDYLSELGPLLEICRTGIAGKEPETLPVSRLAELQQALRRVDLDYLQRDLPQLLEESRQGIERVRRIVLDLKTFSRRDNWELCEVNINDVLESALTIAWNQLKYKAEVIKELAELPPLRCSSTRLSQVFLNLLVNAAQAIDSRGKVRLRTRALGDRIRIMVADTGSGIPPKVRQRIFDPFFTTKQTGEGTGLGLSVAYQIVGLHGGDLRVRSLPGVGTCLVVDLPLSNGASAPEQRAEEA
jgi:signal transduction histidine kinase/FixJ family two-component response regulator